MTILNTSRCRAIAANPLGFTGVARDSPLLLRPNANRRTAELTASGSACSLLFMQDRLFLLSFLQGAQHELVSHFLHHYIYTLGVAPAHVRAHIHSTSHEADDALAHTMQHFARAGVPNASIQVFACGFTEVTKLARINEAIRALPTGGWVINADVDEHFAYPCSLRRQIEVDGHEVFCGEMRDQLAANGLVVELQTARPDGPTIGAQYPKHCYVRQHWRRYAHSNAAVSKVMLMRGETAANGPLWTRTTWQATDGMACAAALWDTFRTSRLRHKRCGPSGR